MGHSHGSPPPLEPTMLIIIITTTINNLYATRPPSSYVTKCSFVVEGGQFTQRERERERGAGQKKKATTMQDGMLIFIIIIIRTRTRINYYYYYFTKCVFFVPQDGHTIWSVVSETSFLPIRAHKKANKAGFEAFLF